MIRRNWASQACRWVSTRPGARRVSEASTTTAPSAVRFGPIAAMVSPSTSKSPCTVPSSGSIVTMVAPVKRTRRLGSVDWRRSRSRRTALVVSLAFTRAPSRKWSDGVA
jgi:hypothetical protein